jgi:hypothetical protein
MGLYERLGGFTDPNPKISVHGFFGAMQEFSLGNMTAAQITTRYSLTAGEQTEAATLRNKIVEPTHADPAVQSALRYIRAFEYENVLIQLEHRSAPYTTVAAVKTRLGV